MAEVFPPRFITPPLETISDPLLEKAGVTLRVKRLDLIHPRISGNKWFKLKLNLHHARAQRARTLLSFGGAYSNHLYALAAVGSHYGFRTIGVVRGELSSSLNSTLAFCRDQGMELIPMTRSDYRAKESAAALAALRERFGDFYLIPEGGGNSLGVRGCMEIAGDLPWKTHEPNRRYVAIACGTGASLAGMIAGSNGDYQLLGLPVLKGAGFLNERIRELLDAAGGRDFGNWRLERDYHFGGYARRSAELLHFIEEFTASTGVPLEPVYTGKLFYGVFDLVRRGVIGEGSEVVVIHTGGLRP